MSLQLIRSDNFNRADSYPSGLGNTSGESAAWTTYNGQWGVISNRAGSNSTANAFSALECGKSDGEINIATYTPTDAGIPFRVSDANNYCLASIKPNQIALFTNTGGSYSSAIGSIHNYTHVDGDVVTVVMDGTSISVRLNGDIVIAPVTITHNSTATQHGLWTYSDSSVRFDNFEFWAEVSGVLTPGTTSFNKSGPSAILVTATDATNGTTPYTYQWQRGVSGGSYSNLSNGAGVSGATTLNLTDGSAVDDVLYSYRLVYTDNVSDSVTSNSEDAKIYQGGPLGVGVVYLAG